MPPTTPQQPHNTKLRIDVVVSEITEGEHQVKELAKIHTIWTNGAEILKNPRIISSKLIIAAPDLPNKLLAAYQMRE